MSDVEILYKLAVKMHRQDGAEGVSCLTSDCDICDTLIRTKSKIDQANEYGESVVLYIP